MQRHRRLAISFATAVLLTGSSVHASADGLRAQSPVVDVGQVVAGDTAVATFVLANDSQRDIRILRAAPS
jgi:hypothetical protein